MILTQSDLEDNSRPIFKHHPTILENNISVQELKSIITPSKLPHLGSLTSNASLTSEQEDFYEISEWIDLVLLGSPRIVEGDNIDLYLSRYKVSDVDDPVEVNRLQVLEWKGLLDSKWLSGLLIQFMYESSIVGNCLLLSDIVCSRESRNTQSNNWLALAVSSHNVESDGSSDGYQIICQPQISIPMPAHGSNDGNPDSEVLNPLTASQRGLYRFLCLEFTNSAP